MYKIKLVNSAVKELQKLDKKNKERVLKALVSLEAEPLLGKPLLGKLKGFFSLRVWPYRIIYQIHKKVLIIIVLEIGHRQSVYRD